MSQALSFSRMDRQIYRPKDAGPHNTGLLSTLGLQESDSVVHQNRRDHETFQVCRHDNFSLVALERRASTEAVGYTRLEDYIKINFWLSGKHTTVLDGFGQHEHERPEVFLISAPQEMIKVDLMNRDTHVAAVALCVLRDFFPIHMGIALDELPDPLRWIALPQERSFAFCRFPLTPDLAAAARAILAAPAPLLRDPLYSKAKSIELMCLLIHLMASHGGEPTPPRGIRFSRESRLYRARAILSQRYAEPITLEQVSREVGLNRLALTSGFRQLFHVSVYDYLQNERMERAFELLREGHRVANVAEAIGFKHPCNFSTAFRAYFGCTPKQASAGRR